MPTKRLDSITSSLYAVVQQDLDICDFCDGNYVKTLTLLSALFPINLVPTGDRCITKLEGITFHIHMLINGTIHA